MGKLKEMLQKFGLKEWGMLLVAGLCCLIIVLPVGEEKAEEDTVGKTEYVGTAKEEEELDYVAQLEKRLENLLSCVENVGEVRVMITVSGSIEKTVLKDGTKETESSTEQDSAGGSRVSESLRTEGTTVFSEQNGESSPYIISETYPEITGVVVIAEGSGAGTVDYDILNAVQVLFNVPAHKIKIMKMK